MSQMDADYRQKIIDIIDAYLAGTATRDATWKWALDLIVSGEWDDLPEDLNDAIHAIFLLHDDEGSWVPTDEELRKIRDNLAR